MNGLIRLLKGIVSWLVVVWSIAFGILAVSLAGARYLWTWQDCLHVFAMLSCGVVAILSAFWAMRSRKRAAAWSLVVVAPTFICWLADASRYRLWIDVAQGAIVVSVCLLIPGVFWLVTYKFRWNELLRRGFSGVARKLAVVGCILVIVVAILVGSLYCALQMPWHIPYRCESTSVLTSPLDSDHAMFVAHRIFPDHQANTLTDPSHIWFPLWTLAVVDHPYWGLPWWNHKIVSVRYISARSQFLFDGERDHGLISGLIPLYTARGCGQTAGLTGAPAQMRILREGPPKAGVRIIGEVSGREHAGVTVLISGPTGIIRTKADEFGVYDLNGLQPGSYRIELDSTDERDHRTDDECGGKNGREVREGEVWGCRLYKYEPIPQ